MPPSSTLEPSTHAPRKSTHARTCPGGGHVRACVQIRAQGAAGLAAGATGVGLATWASPIMLLFTCDYAIFYAPIMLNYGRNYAPNYADYAQIMPIMLILC